MFQSRIISAITLASFLTISPAHANNFGDVLGGIIGGAIANEIQKQNRRTPRKVAPKQNAPKTINPDAQAEPSMSRNEKQLVQSVLNIQGFKAGGEDGVFGKGTRAAVARYQKASGYRATGYLSRDQLVQLKDAYAQAVTSGGHDLPQLVTKADLRVLQVALKKMGYYSSTIDGVIGRGTSRAIQSYLLDRGHDPDQTDLAEAVIMAAEEMQLQTSISKPARPVLFDNSPVFEPAPMKVAQSAPLPEGYLHMKSRGGALRGASRSLVEEFGEDIALQIVAERPDVVKSQKAMGAWFERKFRTQKREQSGFSWKSYSEANFLAKEAIVQEFIGSLLEKSGDLEAVSEQNPKYLALYDVVNTGNFTDGKGLDFSSVRFGGFRVLTDLYYPGTIHNRQSYQVSFEDHFAAPPYLPLSRSSATKFLDDHRGKGLVLVYWIKVTGLNLNENGGTADYEVERLTMHSQNFRIQNVPLRVSATPIFEWAIQDGELVQNLQAEERKRINNEAIAQSGLIGRLKLAFGNVPTREGRLASYSGLNKHGATSALLPRSNPSFWSFYRYINQLSKKPNVLDDQNTLRLLAGSFLTKKEKQEIAPGGGSSNFFDRNAGLKYVHGFYDEFALRDIYQKLREKVEPRFLEAAALTKEPVGVYIQVIADLGKYDFDRQVFPIEYRGSIDPLAKDMRLRASKNRQATFQNGFVFPKELKIPVDEAKALRAKIPTGHPVSMVLRGILTPPKTSQDSTGFAISDIKGTLYGGLGTEIVLATYENTKKGRPASTAKGVDALAAAFDDVRVEDGKLLIMSSDTGYQRINAALLLGVMPDALDEDIIALQIAERLLTALEQSMIWGGGAPDVQLRDLNPFQIRSRAQKLRDEYTELLRDRAIQLPQMIAISYGASVKDYDFENELFPLRSSALPVSPVAYRDAMLMGLSGGYGDITLPQVLRMSPSEAEPIYAALKSNGASILLTSKLTSISDITPLNPTRVGQQTHSGVAMIEPKSFTITSRGIEQPLLDIPIGDPATAPLPGPALTKNQAEIAAITPADSLALMATVAELLGGPEGFENIAKTYEPWLTANEFEQARMLPGVIEKLKSGRPDPLWVEGAVKLGRYQFETETFGVSSDSNDLLRFVPRIDYTSQFDVAVTIELVGASPFTSLTVAPELAEKLVAANQRELKFRIQVNPGSISDAPYNGYNNKKAYVILGRYEQAIFYTESKTGDVEIIARLSATDASTVSTQDYNFSEFSEDRNVLTMHMLDLLMARDLDDLKLDQLMPAFFTETWRSEQLGQSGNGPKYFPTRGDLDPNSFDSQRAKFKGWFLAKSAALGNEFTLTDTMGGYSRDGADCQFLNDYTTSNQGSMYATSGALGEGLDMEADNIELNELDWGNDKPVLAPSLIFGYRVGWPAPNNNDCIDGRWTGMIQVHNVPIPDVRSYYALEYHMRETDVTLIGMDLHFDDQTMRPWIKISAQGLETRLLELNSKRKFEVTQVASLADIAEEKSPTVTTPIPAEPTGPTVPTEPTASETEGEIAQSNVKSITQADEAVKPAEPATSSEGVDIAHSAPPALEGLARDPFDLFDVKLGDNIDTATAKLRQREDLVAVYETTDNDSGDEARLFLRILVFRDAQDAVGLAAVQANSPIVAISRKFALGNGVLPDGLVDSHLVPKYGAADIIDVASGIHGWTTGNQSPENCLFLPGGYLFGRTFHMINPNGTVYAQVDLNDLAPSMPALVDFPILGVEEIDFTEETGSCGDILQFVPGQDGPGGKKSSFTMLLSNIDFLHKQVESHIGAKPVKNIDF